MKLLLSVLLGSSIFIFFNTAHADFLVNDSTKLSGDDVKSAHMGNVRHCSRDDRRTWTYHFYADGNLEGVNNSGTDDSGTWEVNSDGDVCYDWSFIFTDVCHTIFKNPTNPNEFAYVGGRSGKFYTCNFKPINGSPLKTIYPSTSEPVTVRPEPEKSQKTPLEKYKSTCLNLGFTKGTEKFGDCVMKLME